MFAMPSAASLADSSSAYFVAQPPCSNPRGCPHRAGRVPAPAPSSVTLVNATIRAIVDLLPDAPRVGRATCGRPTQARRIPKSRLATVTAFRPAPLSTAIERSRFKRGRGDISGFRRQGVLEGSTDVGCPARGVGNLVKKVPAYPARDASWSRLTTVLFSFGSHTPAASA